MQERSSATWLPSNNTRHEPLSLPAATNTSYTSASPIGREAWPRRCGATLDAAERRIEILMAERGDTGIRVAPFEAESGGAAGDGDEEDLLDDDVEGPDR